MGVNGAPLTIEAQWDDKALRAGLEVMKMIAEVAPKCLITAENGWHSHFKAHDLVQEVLEKEQWQIMKTDLCAVASESADRWGEEIIMFPKKTTAMLVKLPDDRALELPLEEQVLSSCAGGHVG
jgi:hypothetical protein